MLVESTHISFFFVSLVLINHFMKQPTATIRSLEIQHRTLKIQHSFSEKDTGAIVPTAFDERLTTVCKLARFVNKIGKSSHQNVRGMSNPINTIIPN